MPWCPKCKRFQEEDDLCIYCWVETVTELEPEDEQEYKPPESQEPVKPAFLVSASSTNEADVIRSLLKAHDIPSLIRHRGFGEYVQVIMGSSNLGIDVFVPESQLEMATDLICRQQDNVETEVEENGEEMNEVKKAKPNEDYGRKLSWFLLILVMVSAIAGLLIFLGSNVFNR